jgi:hypothetical protein
LLFKTYDMRARWLVITIAGCGTSPARPTQTATVVDNEVSVAHGADAAAASAGPLGCIDIPPPVTDTGVGIRSVTEEAVTFCLAVEEGPPWCARGSLADGRLTVLPPEPPSPKVTEATPPRHINGESIELTTKPEAATVRAIGKDQLEVCSRGGSCQRFRVPAARDAQWLTVNADASLVAIRPSGSEWVEVYEVARKKRIKRFRTPWPEHAIGVGIVLIGDSLLAWDQPAGPTATGDLYAARTGKHLGPFGGEDHFDVYGGTFVHVRGDLWLITGNEETVLLQDMSTDRAARVISPSDWMSNKELRGLPGAALRPGGGFVLVSAAGDIALADPDGAITSRFGGPPRCE